MLFERTIHKGIYEFGYFQGSLFLKVFYHSYKNKALFADDKEASYIISDDKYSLFANITDKFKVDKNKFEFILYYPEDEVYFRWRQSNNPMNEYEVNGKTQVDGFESIDNNHEGYLWGGLVRPTLEDRNQISTFLEGNPGNSFWYYSIGMYQNVYDSWKDSGIPAYEVHYACLIVSVWIKLPYPIDTIFSFIPQKSIFNNIPASLLAIYFIKQ